MDCPECNGRGWKPKVILDMETDTGVKEWCQTCRGTGQVEYAGDRGGVAWERE